jgi:hypothetical protein
MGGAKLQERFLTKKKVKRFLTPSHSPKCCHAAKEFSMNVLRNWFRSLSSARRSPVPRPQRPKSRRPRQRPRLEELETRLVPAFTWVNRGLPSDNFAAVFGARANLARSVVDATLNNWDRIIINLNQPGGGNNINVTIAMHPFRFGNGASTTITQVNQGWPTAASITIDRGNDGAGGGWFLDPTPNDNSAFTGTVVNGFSAFAQAGSPAAGLADLDTVVTHELGHALGISSDLRLRNFSTDTGVPDRSSGNGVGHYYAFVGPSGYSHLMTSFDSGGGGSDFGQAVHSAAAGDPAYPISFGGRTYVGADDLMNPFYSFGQRKLVSNAMASVLREAYNAIVLPGTASRGTFYAVLNQTTGNLLVRGGSGASNDVTTIDVRAGQLFVDVNVGSPVPGTDLTGDITSFFPLSAVRSITIQASDGTDRIDIERLPANTPVSVQAGRGNDTINLSPVAKNLSNLPLTSPVTISGGTGRDSLNIFDDNFAGDRNSVLFSNEFDYGSPFLSTVVFYDSAVTNLLVSAGSASTVNVRGTAAATEIDRAARVNVNDFFDGVQDIRGPVRIQNTPGGRTTLNVDDTSNRNGTTARQSLRDGFDIISGLAPADISYRGSQTGAVGITLGGGANTFTFENTNTASSGFTTTLTGGPGANTVNVLRTTGRLVINGGAGANTYNVGSTDNTLDGIQSDLFVNAGSSNDTLTVNDQGSNIPSMGYVVSGTSVFRVLNHVIGADVRFPNGMRSLVLNAGNGSNDTIDISGFERSTVATTINAGTGGNTVQAGRALIDSLSQILGPLVVNGQGGNTSLTLFDQSTTTAQTYTLTSTSVTRTGGFALTYANIQSLTLNGGSGPGDVFNVEGTAAGTSTTINDGSGGGQITANASTNGPDSLLGPLAVHGRPGFSFLVYVDFLATAAQTYTFTAGPVPLSGTVTRPGAAPVTYDGLGTVNFGAAIVGGNTINVPSVAANVAVNLGVANGDTVTIGSNQTVAAVLGSVAIGPQSDNVSATVVIDDSGNTTPPAGPITFSNVPTQGYRISGLVADPSGIAFVTPRQNTTLTTSLRTGAGDKTFNVQDVPQGVALTLDAGSGTNTLDYTGYAGNVLVNLNPSIHAATGFSSISGIRNVKGASGGPAGSYNALIGNGGNVLTGGNGRRNLLVAGASASALIGGDDDDILIAGTTDYDTRADWQAAFTAIMNEWTQATAYDVRVDHLLNGGGLNDPFLLNATTVHSNGGGNTLTGHNGGANELNLYFANLALGDITDRGPGERLIPIV